MNALLPSIRRFASRLQPLFAPPCCEACGSDSDDSLCPVCSAKWKYLGSNVCEICALPFAGETAPHRCSACLLRPPAYDQIASVFEFEGPVPPLLHAAKFAGSRKSLRILAERARPAYRRCVEQFGPDWIAPMPLNFFRRLKRGYNQSYVLARELGREGRKHPPLLEGIRRKWRAPQAVQGRATRLRTLRGSMRYAGGVRLEGQRILIVDDVVTTGSTVETLARVFKAEGAAAVAVFSLARVRRINKEPA